MTMTSGSPTGPPPIRMPLARTGENSVSGTRVVGSRWGKKGPEGRLTSEHFLDVAHFFLNLPCHFLHPAFFFQTLTAS